MNIPATSHLPLIPAKAGIQNPERHFVRVLWTPAFAGASGKEDSRMVLSDWKMH